MAVVTLVAFVLLLLSINIKHTYGRVLSPTI